MIIDSYRFSAGCTADPNEVWTTADATSDPNCNESSATGALGVWSGTVTKASETTTVNVGTYSVKNTANVSNTVTYVYIDIDLDATYGVGDQFDISFDYYIPGASSSDTSIGLLRLTEISGDLSIGFLTENAWTTVSGRAEINAVGNAWLRIFVDDTTTSAGDGNIIYIDNVSVIAVP